MRRFWTQHVGWIGALVLSAVAFSGQAQSTYQLQVNTTVGTGNTIELDVFIRTGNTPFLLGNANVIIGLDSFTVNPSAAAGINTGTWYWPAGGDGQSYANVSVSGQTNSVQVTVVANSGNSSTALLVDGTLRRLATIRVPILNCAQGSIDPQIVFSPTTTLVEDFAGVTQTFQSQTTPLLVLTPTLVGPNSVLSCPPGATQNYSNGGVVGNWRLVSSTGSTFLGGSTGVDNVTVLFGSPTTGDRTDSLYFKVDPLSNCESVLVIRVSGSPVANDTLALVGSPNVCASDPRITLTLPATEVGVTYQLLRDGVALPGFVRVGPTGGGAITFLNVPLPATVGVSYAFSYQATRPTCSAVSLSPTTDITVVDCNLPVGITGPSVLPICGNSTTSFSVLAPVDPASTYTWTIRNGAQGPRAAIVSATTGTTVNVSVGSVSATQSDTLYLTRILGSQRGEAFVVLQLQPNPTPSISPGAAPNALFPGFAPTATVSYSVASVTPGSSYSWSISPAGGAVGFGTTGTSITGNFTANGTYSVTLTETNTAGCVGSTTAQVVVSNCGFNPGQANPGKTVCVNEPFVVSVDNSYSKSSITDVSVWQVSINLTNYSSASILSADGVDGRILSVPGISTPGTYYFRLSAACGPDTNRSVVIPVIVSPLADPGVVAPASSTICEDQLGGFSLTLSSTVTPAQAWQESTDGVNWSAAIGTVTGNTFTPAPGLTGSIFYRVATVTACDTAFSNSAFVQVDPVPLGAITNFSIPPICVGDQTPNLVGSILSGEIGAWTTTNGAGSFTVVNATTARYTAAPTDNGQDIQLNWVVFGGDCTPDVKSIIVSVGERATAEILTPNRSAVCQGGTLSIDAIGTGGVGTWTLTEVGTGIPGAGTFSPNANTASASYITSLADVGKEFVLRWDVTNTLCTQQTTSFDTIRVSVSALPTGTFPAVTGGPYCAGASTDPLGATLGSPSFRGVWRLDSFGPNVGAGVFSDSLNPNATYNSNILDAGRTVNLNWVITSGGCPPTVITRSVAFNTSTVEGTFNYVGGDDADVIRSVCQADASPLLYGKPGPGTSGVTLVAANGFGVFDSTVVAPDSVVYRYLPDTLDIGRRIEIVYSIFAPSCQPRRITRFLNVLDSPNGVFAPINDVCYPFVSDTLVGNRRLGDPNATSQWIAVGATSPGSFIPNDTTEVVRFVPALSDTGRTIELLFIVRNSACPPDTNRQFVQVLHENQLRIVSSDADNNICFGDTITLSAQLDSGLPPATFSWSPAAGVDNPAAQTVTISPAITRQFSVRADVGNCTFFRNQTVTVQQGGQINALATSTNICNGQRTRLSVGGDTLTGAAAEVRWRVVTGDVASLGSTPGSEATKRSPLVSPTVTTIYEVFARTSNGCGSVDQITIDVTPNTPPAIQDAEFCEIRDDAVPVGTPVVTQFTYSPTVSDCDTVYWYRGDFATLEAAGFPASQRLNIPRGSFSDSTLVDSILGIGSQVYTIECVKLSTCVSYAENTITLVGSPSASFEARSSVSGLPFDPNPITVPSYERDIDFNSTTPNAIAYFWNFGDPDSGTLNFDTLATTSHFYTRPGLYSVVLLAENALGCADLEVRTDYVNIESVSYFFPTAFTPNGDGLNDVFRPVPNELDVPGVPTQANPLLLDLNIYDRWGLLVYQATDPALDPEQAVTLWQEGWNGRTATGEDFDPGTYSYLARIQFPGEGIVTYRGIVTLIR